MFVSFGPRNRTSSTRSTRHAAEPAQRSFDDLGAPLDDVTFCVLDLETTGGSALDCSITEIGAVRVRGGECLGTFGTLVNPGRAIPPTITILTGITDSMVVKAPRLESVLGSFLDFIGDAVIVGHNIRFDMSFIQAALARDDRAALTNPTVDTVALARRLVRDEVPNCKLGTLAERFRLPHQPNHRALDDAWATADLLHILLERAGGLGVSGLDDLRALPTLAGSAAVAKLRLTERLPRSPGVYLFRDRAGRVIYVGKATNLRARVRQYFSSDDRRKTGALLRETEQIDHKRCESELEAAVLEMRLIHHLLPRYNSAGTRWEKACYVRLDPTERYPRLKVVRKPSAAGDAVHVGPLPSRRAASLVVEAIHSAIPLRQCTTLPGRSTRSGACLAAQLGLARCPCTGDVTPEQYRPTVERALLALRERPELVTDLLRDRMMRLAGEERFEEAAAARDRLAAFEDAVARQRRFDRLRADGRLVVRDRGGLTFAFERGVLAEVGAADDPDAVAALQFAGMSLRPVQARPPCPGPPDSGPLDASLADELSIVGRFLERNDDRLEVLESESIPGPYR